MSMNSMDVQMATDATDVANRVDEATEATEALRFTLDLDIDQTNDINQLKMLCSYQREEIIKLQSELASVKKTLGDTQSHLDKFKSVYNSGKHEFYTVPLSPKLQKKPRNTRLMGISAEPQTSVSLQDLMSQKLPEYPKEERWVALFISSPCLSFSFIRILMDLNGLWPINDASL